MMKKALLICLLAFPFAQAMAGEITEITYEPRPGAYEHMTLDEVRTRMIKESVAAHPECPCPYSPDKIGGNCGTHCQYYRSGGYRVKCFLKDISTRDIYFYKLKNATPGAM